MTVSELKDILALHGDNGYDASQVYVEIQLADQVYIQKPVEHVRIENGTYTNICIIAGINGDRLES